MKFSIVNIGTNTGASGTTLAVTVPAAGVPRGALIFVAVTEKSTSGTNGSLADTAGNSYGAALVSGSLAGAIANGRGMLFAVNNAAALVSGNTITYTRNLSGASCAMSAFYVIGATRAATFTEGSATATGTTGTITVTSGTLGAGDLVLGVLFDSGTSTAGGNATFTNAAGFVTPPNEATTGGSGGSRVDGGTLFKAASGTQVYNPTLSSTAQQWLLAVLGIIPAPDAGVVLDRPALRGKKAAVDDFINLLPLHAAVLPYTFRAPLIVKIPPTQKAKVDDVGNLLPIQPQVLYEFRAPLYARLPDPRPKAVGEALGTPLPMVPVVVQNPFHQDLWENAARAWPKAVGEAIGGDAPLLTPNPAIPFNQDLWEGAAKPLPKAIGEAIAGDAPLLTPNPTQPFAQSDWFQIRSTQKAKVDDVANLLPTQSVVVVQNPFNQNDWRNAAPRPIKITDTSFTAPAPLYSPNPAQPFVQSIWDSATPAKPKAYAEPIAAIAPLYTPNPARPFTQGDWPSASIVAKPAKVDTIELLLPIYAPNPARPFTTSTETRTVAFQIVKSDIFVNLLPLQTPVVVGNPFHQDNWPSTARLGPSDRSFAAGINLPLITPPPVVTGLPHNQPFINSTVGRMFGR